MLYILIPTYNEAQNLSNLSRELQPFLERNDVQLVLSDDGSTDGTVPKAGLLFPSERTKILGDGINRGPGYAFQVGFAHILATAEDTDTVVTMEADCTSDIGILSDMISISELGYHLVLASVYAQGGGFDKTTLLRRFLSTIANFFFRFFFDLKVNTLSSFYRVYNVGKLKEVQVRWPVLIEETGFICMLELLLKMVRCNARIIEVPMILSSNKRVGRSKMKLVSTSMAYLRFLWRFRSQI